MLKENPKLYEDLYADLVSLRKGGPVPYVCEAVQDVITQLGPFSYEG